MTRRDEGPFIDLSQVNFVLVEFSIIVLYPDKNIFPFNHVTIMASISLTFTLFIYTTQIDTEKTIK